MPLYTCFYLGIKILYGKIGTNRYVKHFFRLCPSVESYLNFIDLWRRYFGVVKEVPVVIKGCTSHLQSG